MTKVLVAYMSSTGNTKKVAEAIYGAISAEKELKPISEVEDLGGYDLAFLGFPTRMMGPDKKAKKLLERHCTQGRKVALFVTHGAREDEPDVQEWMAKFKQAASGAELVGAFDCQGQMASGVKTVIKIFGDKELKAKVRADSSAGQPDEARLERARAFATETMSRLG